MKKVLLGVMVVLAGLTVPQVHAQEAADIAKEAEAIKAAEAWLALVDDAKYDETWDQAAKVFKDAITRENWITAVTTARGSLGPLSGRTVVAKQYTTQLPNAPVGEYVVVQYASNAADGTPIIESVTPMLDNGTWKVAGYFIQKANAQQQVQNP